MINIKEQHLDFILIILLIIVSSVFKTSELTNFGLLCAGLAVIYKIKKLYWN